jgi:hypothetical protein
MIRRQCIRCGFAAAALNLVALAILLPRRQLIARFTREKARSDAAIWP